jgi:hypothetical protein
MNWLHYLLEANIYLAVFYACYCLFLNKETYYTLNRAYLLLSCILSFILPVIQIGALKPAAKLPEITAVSYNVPVKNVMLVNSPVVQPAVVHQITWDNALWCAYIVGIAVLTLLLVIKLFRLINLTTSGKKLIDNKYRLIDVEDTDTAFSFFNYLFIGTKTTGNDIIIQHELVHIRQKHSFDIVFIELIKIINWFNPIIYLLQISLKTVHEYIADEQTAAQRNDTLAYSTFLVDNAYGLTGSSVTHSFFNYNLLKKRIIMLNQKRSGRLARLKYLVAIPIFGGMLCASTLAFSKNYALIDLAPKHKAPLIAAAKAPKNAVDTLSHTQIKSKAITGKGYKYEETGYLVNNKTDFRVIITDKNGAQKEYYKSKASTTELAMLQEKYGYTFPKMLVFPKMPPPPPMPPTTAALHKNLHRLPPPPPAPLVASIDMKMPPPPPPAAPVHSKGAKKIPPPPAPPVVSADFKVPPPPPPAAPVHSKDMNKMPPPPPPAPPVPSADLKIPPPPPPVPPKHGKKGTKWIPAVAPGPDVKPVSPEPAVAPAEPAASSDIKPTANIKAKVTTQLHNAFTVSGSKGKFEGKSSVIESTKISYFAKNDNESQPLFIVNNQIVDKHLNKGQRLDITADKILLYVGLNSNKVAKWGNKAQNGVVEVIGDNKISIQAN